MNELCDHQNAEIVSIDELLNDHQLYHSDFQMDYFITARSGGTIYGCYKQALRELYKRHRGLKELNCEKELLIVDIEELRNNGPEFNTSNRFEEQRNNIKLKRKLDQLSDLERNIRETKRELDHFHNQASALKEKVGELTKEKRLQLDQEMWLHKVKVMAAVDFITTGRLGGNTIEFIASLPVNLRQPMLEEIKKHGALIEWLETNETKQISHNNSFT